MSAAVSPVVVVDEEDVELLDDEADETPDSQIRALVVIDPAAIPRRPPPRASIPPSSEPLSARAELVYYYVDGRTPVLALVAVCPLSEGETLRALRELLRGRIVCV
jgi:hypothetical protein